VSEQPVYLLSARLPRRPGRPRKTVSGHVTGTSDSGDLDNSGHHGRAVAQEASALLLPRLLDVHGLAAYLSMPEATVYDLAARGVLRRVRVPLPDGSDLRKLLFDRQDVDRIVESWKE
jgi:hypothetical protein